jgi:hypothetical protein
MDLNSTLDTESYSHYYMIIFDLNFLFLIKHKNINKYHTISSFFS